jgi:hypothetical protein
MLQKTIEVGDYVSTLSFDITKSILITDIGFIKIDKTRVPPLAVSSRDVGSERGREGLGIRESWVI